MSILGSVLLGALKFILGLFAAKEPIREIIDRPKPEAEISDGKTDKERLSDFDL